MIEKSNSEISFSFDPLTLRGRIFHKPSAFAWTIDLAAAPGVDCGAPEPMSTVYPWEQTCRAKERVQPLTPKDLKSFRELPNGVHLDFEVRGAKFDVRLSLSDEPSELLFELRPSPKGRADLIAAELPGPLQPENGNAVQVLTHFQNQGKLYTGARGALRLGRGDDRIARINDGHQRMRFFGVLGDTKKVGHAPAGYVAITEENADSETVLRRDDAGKLSCAPGWLPSMGTVSYPRRIRYRFIREAGVTEIAKEFRSYIKKQGLLKLLKEKMEERPPLKQLIGATGVFLGCLDGPFDYVGTLRRLKQMGHERFFLFPVQHINNQSNLIKWGKLIDLREKLDELKSEGALTCSWTYLAGIESGHNLNRIASRNPDGSIPLNWNIGNDYWYQGCPISIYHDFLQRDTEINSQPAHHFDTTVSNALMECYQPSHFCDRRTDRSYRTKLLDEVIQRGGIVSSEGVKDWALPHYDIGSNKERAFPAAESSHINVPLQHLVCHDTIFSIWWEGDTYDSPHWAGGDPVNQSLTDLLYGDMPLISPACRSYKFSSGMGSEPIVYDLTLDDAKVQEAAQLAVRVAKNFGRVATEELTRFQLLEPDGSVQQTEFSNGVSVIANFRHEPFRTENGLTVPAQNAVVL